MNKVVFWLKFHWSLLLRVQLMTSEHWFRYCLGTEWATNHYLNYPISWRIYAALWEGGGDKLITLKCRLGVEVVEVVWQWLLKVYCVIFCRPVYKMCHWKKLCASTVVILLRHKHIWQYQSWKQPSYVYPRVSITNHHFIELTCFRSHFVIHRYTGEMPQ